MSEDARKVNGGAGECEVVLRASDYETLRLRAEQAEKERQYWIAKCRKKELTAEELNALRYPLAPGNHAKHLAALTKLGWEEPAGNDHDSERTIFYGPHPCERCGRPIIRKAESQGGTEYDAPEGPIYPNTRWTWHDCPERTEPEPHPVRPHMPGAPKEITDGQTITVSLCWTPSTGYIPPQPGGPHTPGVAATRTAPGSIDAHRHPTATSPENEKSAPEERSTQTIAITEVTNDDQ